MNSPDPQVTPIDRLLVGCRGVPVELVAVINVCRCFDGTVLVRDHDVMVLEFGADPAIIDEVLARLPRHTITHVWRSGRQTVSRAARAALAPALPRPSFCST